MINPIFLALSAYLKTLEGIAHVDVWNNQMANDPEPYSGAGSAFPTPAVFVEFPPATFQSVGRHVQRTELKPRLHLVTERYAATDSTSADQVAALSADTNLVQLLAQHLTGWRHVDGDGRTVCNTWSRTGLANDNDFTNVVETVVEWRTVAYDYSGVRPTTPIAAPSPTLEITGTTA
jgi:hypothetical protein